MSRFQATAAHVQTTSDAPQDSVRKNLSNRNSLNSLNFFHNFSVTVQVNQKSFAFLWKTLDFRWNFSFFFSFFFSCFLLWSCWELGSVGMKTCLVTLALETRSTRALFTRPSLRRRRLCFYNLYSESENFFKSTSGWTNKFGKGPDLFKILSISI